MKKENRICKNEEFQEIIRLKQSVANACFVMYFRKNNSEKTRIGISVSKKLGNAVVRNKIKRQIRSLVQETIELNNGFDYIIIVRNKYITISYSQAKKEIQYLLKKVKKRMGN
ncbi:ribonuclease P protein component [Tannockella kyphosi]|uniref:ribonuclease P protein component n=1 Tax=Tannockella kyphosi TaxID=2899121 RepID=UPI002011E28E|nr:ribonuclease P protein component [Tannockella kyphosi]